MATLLEELAELDRRFRDGSLSDRAFRRAKEAMIDRRAGTSTLGQSDTEPRRAPRQRRDRTRPAATVLQRDRAIRKGGAAAMTFAMLILGIAFCEVLAQALDNGLPYHRVAGQLVLLPGAAAYLYQGIQTGSLAEHQLVLAGLLTGCYLLIPYAAARGLRGGGGLLAGFSIAVTYIAGAAVVSHLYLTAFQNFKLNLWEHTVIPALIGAAVLGAFFGGILTIRRALS